MGILNSLFGGGRPSKNDLIRSLAKQRIRHDPMATAMGFSESMVDSLGIFQLIGLPEGTIVTIVETYAALKKHNVAEHEIFERIEKHRSRIGIGDMPNPPTLNSYIQYRIAIEHAHGSPISDDFIAQAIQISYQHFTC